MLMDADNIWTLERGSNKRTEQLLRPDEELRNLYLSPNIIRVIKLRRIKWAEHVIRMTNIYKILFQKPDGRDQQSGWEDVIKVFYIRRI